MNVDGYFLPRADQTKLVELLATIPDVCEDLTITLTRQDRLTTGSLKVSNGSDEQPLPISEGAMEAADLLRNTLAGWVRHVCEERVMTYEGRGDTVTLARWLSRWHVALAMSEGAGESLGEIRYAVSVARRAVDRPRDPRWMQASPWEASRQLLNARGIEHLAKELGKEYENLDRERVRTLERAEMIHAVEVDEGSDEQHLFEIGEVLAAHRAHPVRKSRKKRIAA